MRPAPPESTEITEAASPTLSDFRVTSPRLSGSSALRCGNGFCLIGERCPGLEQRMGNRAIEQARVEMAKAIMGGEPLAERALARRGRTIDGDDHDSTAPSPRIMPAKSGKLVAMKAVSSAVTGASADRPMTKADIAMR